MKLDLCKRKAKIRPEGGEKVSRPLAEIKESFLMGKVSKD